MYKPRMKQPVLTVSLGLIVCTGSHIYAAENDVAGEARNNMSIDSESVTTVIERRENPTTNQSNVNTEANVDSEPPVSSNASEAVSSAAEAVKQQEDDVTSETNLEEAFTSSERRYSLNKQKSLSLIYDLGYTYYRDTQVDNMPSVGLRYEEDATHTLTNTFTAQYGLLDNLTLTASLPLVAKTDSLKDTNTAGLGDISFGARWEPFPLKQGRLPLILYGNFSTKTGDSPYEINYNDDLSTGKGYYSIGGGASTRKYIDPVVLFASASANYGFKETGLNQRRGLGILQEFDPGISGGFALGFAYSFNYDVSMTMSYQQSFNTNAEFTMRYYDEDEQEYRNSTNTSSDQTSASVAFSLGVRVSPKTIVNGTVGFGLTDDAPDVSLGLSFPLDVLGFGNKK